MAESEAKEGVRAGQNLWRAQEQMLRWASQIEKQNPQIATQMRNLANDVAEVRQRVEELIGTYGTTPPRQR